MKKTVLTMMMMGVMLIGFAQQRQLPMSEYVVSKELNEYLTPAKVEQMRANQPAELIRMNYIMLNGAKLITKELGGNTKDMGYLKDYTPAGVVYNEAEILDKSWINPFLWNLPQDQYRTNIFKLKNSDYFIMVLPTSVMEERINAQMQQYGVHK